MIDVLTVASPTLVVASSQAGVDLENRHLLLMREYIQGGFFDWSTLKMNKYEEKLKYLNWSTNWSSRKVLSVNPQ